MAEVGRIGTVLWRLDYDIDAKPPASSAGGAFSARNWSTVPLATWLQLDADARAAELSTSEQIALVLHDHWDEIPCTIGGGSNYAGTHNEQRVGVDTKTEANAKHNPSRLKHRNPREQLCRPRGTGVTFYHCWTLLVSMDTEGERAVELHIPYPFGEEQVFRYAAMEDILELLTRNPFREFTVRQLREITDNGSKTTTRAVDLLQQLELISVDEGGRSRSVRLHRDHVTIPDEPLFAIPQDEFREPIREFTNRARTEVPSFSALAVFGSVARGEADRQSDIDIWILIDDEENLLAARRTAAELTVDLGEKQFGDTGSRYAFEVLVESVTSALDHARADDRIVDVLAEGIVIEDSDALEQVKDVVLSDVDAT
ncbi:nucleotidyltransferase domain-containing protein [Halolamina rubra]|uniref:nucleotidyltransferase domain-containing protein n=1 Tax=Halolamina rubra TaxID=1380430 RepID=UPI0012AC0AF3|nr:nucleotidyltransferase domain-containing protein [Halolamina rubra]